MGAHVWLPLLLVSPTRLLLRGRCCGGSFVLLSVEPPLKTAISNRPRELAIQLRRDIQPVLDAQGVKLFLVASEFPAV